MRTTPTRVHLYATALKDAGPGPWRMVGIDPEGCDLMLRGGGAPHRFRAPSPRRMKPARNWSACTEAGRGIEAAEVSTLESCEDQC